MASGDTPEYCPRCGSSTPENAGYCPECGADLLAYSDDGEDTTSGDEQRPTDDHLDTEDSTDGGSSGSDRLISRRGLLLGGGGLVGGGALLFYVSNSIGIGRPQHRVYADGWDVTREEGTTSVRVTGTVTLPAGRYAARRLSPQVAVDYQIEYDVIENDPIDVFVLPESEYDRYRDRDRNTQTIAGLAEIESSRGILSGSVSPGDYNLVLDNTGVFGADPNGEVEVEVDMVATF